MIPQLKISDKNDWNSLISFISEGYNLTSLNRSIFKEKGVNKDALNK